MNQPGNPIVRRPLWQRPAIRGIASVLVASGVVVAALMLRPNGGAGGSGPTLPPASTVAVVPSLTPAAPTAPLPSASPVQTDPTNPPASGPGTGPISPGGGMALCVESYDLETLAHREFAFDGTVTAINGDEATFHVNVGFRGSGGSTITLVATGMTGGAITLGGGPNLRIGDRYLVAGDEHFAWGCGFSQPYDARIASDWAAALK